MTSIHKDTTLEDFYPMPMFINLEVADLDASAEWYQEALGFRVVFRTPELVHLRRERYQDVLLLPSSEGESISPGEGVVIQFQAGDTSVSKIASNAQRVVASNLDGPVEQPWNVRELTVQDPDGYRVRFSEPINPNLTFGEVMDTE
jgi:catechol 2,3-dioxygenase-like lactoylglutathione lyase family enzyme